MINNNTATSAATSVPATSKASITVITPKATKPSAMLPAISQFAGGSFGGAGRNGGITVAAGAAGGPGNGGSGGSPLRVAAYCRVSTDTEEQSTSFNGQVNAYTSLINSNPEWILAEIYADDGITGTSAQKRPKFMQMIQDCEAGKIDLILTKSISRFARNTLECLSYVRHLNSLGTHIIFENNGIDTRANYSEMLLTILAAFAQEESRSISENTKWGIRKRFEVGEARWSRIYGYDKGYVVNPQEAAVVQKIFNLYEHGMSTNEIGAWLTAHHIKSPGGTDKWSQQTICHMLMNEKYTGDLKLQKYYTEDHISHNTVKNDDVIPSFRVDKHHTPIVSRKQFNRVDAIMKMRTRQHHKIDKLNSNSNGGANGGNGSSGSSENLGWNDQYPLGDKVICPYCKNKLYQKGIDIHRKYTQAWCCERGGNPCGNFVIRSPYVEDGLLKAYEMLGKKALNAKLRKLEGKLQSEQTKLQRLLQQQEERLLQADGKADDSKPDDNVADKPDVKAEERAAEIQSKIKALTVQKRAAEVMLKIKEKTPAFKRVDFWWVDELVDHIEFGNHSVSERELMRQRALTEARRSLLQSTDNDNDDDHSDDGGLVEFAANSDEAADKPVIGSDDNNTVAENAEVAGLEVMDDRVIRIFWKCGIVSTVSSGINTDEDAPRHLAEMLNKSRKGNSKKANSKKADGGKSGNKKSNGKKQ